MNQGKLWDFQDSPDCSVTLENGSLVLKTPYDPSLVAQIKSLPYSDRKWDPARKVWLISPGQAATLQIILSAYFGDISIPAPTTKIITETRLLEIHYIGLSKDHGDGERSAYGMDSQDNWIVIFPEKVLRAWFETEDAGDPTQSTTLYGILGIKHSAGPDELRSAFRRLAIQWHPDRNHEPNANEVFLRIQEAYNILSNPNKRARYDAGLALEKTIGHETKPVESGQTYRTPLRSGLIMATGHQQLDRFIAEKILAWEDVVNQFGQVLVSSWKYGDKQVTRVWA